MKLVTRLIPFLVVGCASSSTEDTGPLARCDSTDCFSERDVRDFEIIDRSTVVVYVGSQRCPFVLELDGLNCDVTFMPQIQFFQGALGRVGQATSVASSQVCNTSRGLYVYAGILDPGILTANSRMDPITGRRTGPGGFGRPATGGLGDPVPIDPTSGDMCRVQQIRSVNDDQLVELYVARRITPPPPPVGAGELEVPDENDRGPEGNGETVAPPSEDDGNNDTGRSAED